MLWLRVELVKIRGIRPLGGLYDVLLSCECLLMGSGRLDDLLRAGWHIQHLFHVLLRLVDFLELLFNELLWLDDLLDGVL